MLDAGRWEGGLERNGSERLIFLHSESKLPTYITTEFQYTGHWDWISDLHHRGINT
jgi:hypothetical protein